MSGSFPGGSSSLLDRGHDDLSLIIVCEKWRRLIGKAIGGKRKRFVSVGFVSLGEGGLVYL